jgi:hydrogenase nickel incorporation protein HypB
MCDSCGCGETDHHDHDHDHDHDDHDHHHGPHDHVHGARESIELVPTSILKANDEVAARVRSRLSKAGILAVNLIGTPGAGKTALLEATIPRLPESLRAAVVVGDLATENDARRLKKLGVRATAIETGTGCHLNAPMVERALDQVPLSEIDLLFIENVGNLVCPSLFDLGEAAKVALISVTEGTDKPEKYPVIVQRSSLLIITKTDLLPYVDFDLAESSNLARRVHPEIEIMSLSARAGTGLEPWLSWLMRHHQEMRATAP